MLCTVSSRRNWLGCLASVWLRQAAVNTWCMLMEYSVQRSFQSSWVYLLCLKGCVTKLPASARHVQKVSVAAILNAVADVAGIVFEVETGKQLKFSFIYPWFSLNRVHEIHEIF